MDLRYPTGRFAFEPVVTSEQRTAWIATIGAFPGELRQALAALPAGRLDTPYRPGGWTARQVVHHVADSHMNAYIRFRLVLTEDTPPLKPYAEHLWAELSDARTEDPSVSVQILEGVHRRLHALLEGLEPGDVARVGRHPQNGDVTVDWLLQMYAWHGRHHLGHLNLVAAG